MKVQNFFFLLWQTFVACLSIHPWVKNHLLLHFYSCKSYRMCLCQVSASGFYISAHSSRQNWSMPLESTSLPRDFQSGWGLVFLGSWFQEPETVYLGTFSCSKVNILPSIYALVERETPSILPVSPPPGASTIMLHCRDSVLTVMCSVWFLPNVPASYQRTYSRTWDFL